MKSNTRKGVGILIIAMWISYTPYLHPLPWTEISNISNLSEDDIPWLSDKENAIIERFWESMPAMIWTEWALNFFLISTGIIFAALLLGKQRYPLLLCPIPSTVLLFIWYFRHTSNPIADIPGVQERTLLESLFTIWSDLQFLVNHTGNYLHFFDFLYYEVAFPIVHACLVVLFMYWIYESWYGGNEFRE